MVEARDRRRARRRIAAFYRTFIERGDLCFDIGANVGERSRVLQSLGARVIAVEPQPTCVSMLERIPNITVVAAGVGATVGAADLHLTHASTLASMAPGWIREVQGSGRFANFEWDEQITVPLTTLDRLIAKYGRPEFVKIDVEGYEPQAIAGLSQAVPLLCFEFTPEWRSSTTECVARLDALGMRAFNFSEGESQRFSLEEWVDGAGLMMMLERISATGFGDVYARSSTSRALP